MEAELSLDNIIYDKDELESKNDELELGIPPPPPPPVFPLPERKLVRSLSMNSLNVGSPTEHVSLLFRKLYRNELRCLDSGSKILF